MPPRKPTFAPEVYPQIGLQLGDIYRGWLDLHRGNRRALIEAMAGEIAANRLCSEARAPLGLRQLRDVAWWAGASHVGASVHTAAHALASAWVSFTELQKAALRDRSVRARITRIKVKRMAHAEGISVREMQARQRRQQALSHTLIRARLDRAFTDASLRGAIQAAKREWYTYRLEAS